MAARNHREAGRVPEKTFCGPRPHSAVEAERVGVAAFDAINTPFCQISIPRGPVVSAQTSRSLRVTVPAVTRRVTPEVVPPKSQYTLLSV
jgi:hypothetical protein